MIRLMLAAALACGGEPAALDAPAAPEAPSAAAGHAGHAAERPAGPIEASWEGGLGGAMELARQAVMDAGGSPTGIKVLHITSGADGPSLYLFEATGEPVYRGVVTADGATVDLEEARARIFADWGYASERTVPPATAAIAMARLDGRSAVIGERGRAGLAPEIAAQVGLPIETDVEGGLGLRYWTVDGAEAWQIDVLVAPDGVVSVERLRLD